jgi:hypothetical protein
MRSLSRLMLIAAVLSPMIGTSSEPKTDWYVFDIPGKLVATTGPAAGRAVVVLGWRSWENHWQALNTCDGYGAEPYGPFVASGVTDEEGRFRLRVSVCGSGYPSHDSLAIAVVEPDTAIVGSSFSYDIVDPTVIEEQYTREKRWGCDEQWTFPDGYIYQYPALSYPIP